MAENDGFRIDPARTADDMADVAGLFRAYAASLDVDLGYQNFAAELAGLPGPYAPPDGALLVARRPDGLAVGCVGLRPLPADGICEMKRLFIIPEARGGGLGRRMVEAILNEGACIGYREMRLDTLPSMAEALAMYGRLGFQRVEAYYDTPIAGTIFMQRRLTG